MSESDNFSITKIYLLFIYSSIMLLNQRPFAAHLAQISLLSLRSLRSGTPISEASLQFLGDLPADLLHGLLDKPWFVQEEPALEASGQISRWVSIEGEIWVYLPTHNLMDPAPRVRFTEFILASDT
jgi:hypothetical protein